LPHTEAIIYKFGKGKPPGERIVDCFEFKDGDKRLIRNSKSGRRRGSRLRIKDMNLPVAMKMVVIGNVRHPLGTNKSCEQGRRGPLLRAEDPEEKQGQPE
jgi:hypothetical protein